MKNNIFDLSGQVALVAGGSSGLGLQFARAMANAGANVALVARRMDLLEENAKAISAEFGVEVYPHYIDLRDPDSVTACVKDVVAHFGKIDILVNAGGVGGSGDPALMTDEQWYYVVDTDLTGLFRLCREVARLSMIPNNYGRIVNVSSMHGFVSRKHVWTAPYCAAKGGVHMMTKALANDWASTTSPSTASPRATSRASSPRPTSTPRPSPSCTATAAPRAATVRPARWTACASTSPPGAAPTPRARPWPWTAAGPAPERALSRERR